MSLLHNGAYGADDDIVDYILGITFEIWEERGIELIQQYYGPETTVYALDGIVRGAAAMINGTRSMLAAFPDRLLLPDDVIWSDDGDAGFYTSHRIASPMTNSGPSAYGPATDRKVNILTIADCVVSDGVITKEWLIRDNHALVTQLGFDPLAAAKAIAAKRNEETSDWIAAEIVRLKGQGILERRATPSSSDTPRDFSEQVLSALWAEPGDSAAESVYAPYAVMQRSPVTLLSGRTSIDQHYATLRNAISVEGVAVDHVATQPFGENGQQIAVRWTVAGTHSGDYLGCSATGKTVFVLGATHWRIVGGKIIREWTIFDSLGVLSQIV